MSHQIVEHISGIIRDRFHIAADDELFDQDVHLFEEGYVDSLGVVDLITKLERTYAIKLPDEALFSEGFTTVRGIAQTVERLIAESKPQARDPELQPLVVELSERAEGTPLFCLYGLYIYKALADALGDEGPVYGVYLPVEARAEAHAKQHGVAPQLPSVEQSARDYVQVIRDHQPHGPYRLLGMSYAGVIAYETARQLTAQNEEVEMVALLDSVLPGSLTLAPGRWMAQHLREFVRQGPQYAQNRLRKRLRKLGLAGQAANPEPPKVSEGEALPGENLMRAEMYTEVITAYERRMGPYAGHVVLYKANRDDFSRYARANDHGWGRYVPHLTVVEVQGTHTSILKSPVVAADLCCRLAAPRIDHASSF